MDRNRLCAMSASVGWDRGADRASNDPHVSSIPPIIPYGGFSLSTAGRLAFQTAPSRVASSLSLLPAYAVPDSVCIRPSCIAWLNVASVLCRSIHSPMHHRGGWVALRPRGPRSGPGCSVLVRHHLIGPIRPTRGHIAISPFDGLYVMPSLCGSA